MRKVPPPLRVYTRGPQKLSASPPSTVMVSVKKVKVCTSAVARLTVVVMSMIVDGVKVVVMQVAMKLKV